MKRKGKGLSFSLAAMALGGWLQVAEAEELVVWHDLGDNGINWFNELSELYQSVDPETTITSVSYPTDQWFGKWCSQSLIMR
jgi:hypothetical protein